MVDIAVVDYGMGNLRSVTNALTFLGASVVVAHEPAALSAADRVVLPGVGAFGDGMANLEAGGWVDALEAEVRDRGKPFLGLCLGMQLLAAKGTEHGEHGGLGWIAGSVVRLPTEPGLRVPHVGWNDLLDGRGPLYEDIPLPQPFYFVHSYVLKPDDVGVVTGQCEYGGSFVASIGEGNVHGTQFHPEKSQHAGLRLLRNFLDLPC